MRVLFFSSVFKQGYGVGLVIRKQAEGLLEQGHEVYITTPDADEYEGRLNVIKAGTDYDSTRKLVAGLRPDVTVVHTPPYFAHVARLNDFQTVKVAYDHGEPFPSFFQWDEMLQRETVDRDKYRTISEFHLHISISEFIKKCSGIRDSVVIYNGTDHLDTERIDKGIDVRAHLGLDSSSFLVTSLSRIGVGEGFYKGFDLLEEVKKRALKLLGDPKDVVFLVMGRSLPPGNMAEQQLRDAGFLVLTDVEEAFKKEVLSQSSIFVSSSLWEGFNLPLVEAQHAGVPSLAFSVGAQPEVCPFHFGSVDELVRHLKMLYDNKVYREWCGKTCSNYVTGNFRWEHNVSRLVSVLKDAVGRKDQLQTIKYRTAARNELMSAKNAKRIHIPKVLYHWRVSENSTAQNPNAKLYACESAKKALKEHLNRVGLKGTVKDGLLLGSYKIDYAIDSYKISIIIPNKDHKEDLEKCINSIIEKSTYKNYEIIIAENNSKDNVTFDYYKSLQQYPFVKTIYWDKPFNYSAINNYAANHANGQVLLFLNNDTEVITPNWLEEMLMFAQRSDVGAVGAKLLYQDNTIQHAGIIIGIGGVAGHAFRYFDQNDHGYFGRLKIAQNFSAVTGACLMIRKKVFDEINCFDEGYPVAFGDVDLCMKVRDKNYLVVWTPYALLYHHESKTRGYDDTEEKQRRLAIEVNLFHTKWGEILKKGDPYYNPNLTLDREDFSIDLK